MKLFMVVLIICSILVNQYSLAQTKKTTDTLYYLVDTVKTPALDRIVEVGTEVYYNSSYPRHLDTIKYIRINCQCLPFRYYPTLTAPIKKTRTTISSQDLHQINFISLSELLAVIIKDYKHGFNDKHTMMIIQTIEGKYYKFKSFLTEYQNPSLDYEIITTPLHKQILGKQYL